MASLSDRLCQLGGADLKVLERARSEHSKLAALGLVMLFTASVAALSMVFALRNAVLVVVDENTWVPAAHQPTDRLVLAIILGILWGCLILALDRALIITMQDVAGPRVILYALPRLALAIVIGMVVSIPITIQAFHSEIAAEIKSQNIDSLEQTRNEIQNGPVARDLKNVRDEIETQEKILRGDVESVETPESKAAQTRYDNAVTAEQSANEDQATRYTAMICERTGAGASHPECNGIASDIPGRGDLYYAREKEYNDAYARWQSAKSELTAAKTELEGERTKAANASSGRLAEEQTQANIKLCGTRPESNPIAPDPTCTTGLRQKEKYLDTQLQAMLDPGAILSRQGLSQQIKALFSLGSAHLWVAALFMVIELLPVLVKMFMAIKGVTQYDRIAKKLRDEEFFGIESDTEERQSQRDREVRKRETIREDMLKKEIALGKTANEHVAEEMELILTDALQQWSAQVRATLNANPATQGSSRPKTTQTASPYGLPDEDDL